MRGAQYILFFKKKINLSEYEQCKGRVQKRTDGKLVGDRGGQKEEKRPNRIVNCRGNKQLSGGKNGEGAIE